MGAKEKPMPAEQPQPSGRDLHILTVCPLCHATYNPLKTQIMAERDDAHVVYLECRQCGSAVVALVTTGLAGLSSVGTVTDLTTQEIVETQHHQPINDNDVLELYAWLGGEHAVTLH